MSNNSVRDEDWRLLSGTAIQFMKNIRSSEHSPELRGVYHKAFATLLRRFTDRFWYDRKLVSQACLLHSQTHGINDIRRLDPLEIQPAELRKFYRLEHYLPIADLQVQLMAIEYPDKTKVETVLRTAPIQKIWITIEEDARLKRFNRGDPADAYRVAGIEVVFD